jgi:phosphoribulokinase
VSFFPPESDPEEMGAYLNVAHILRPTLPHLDLTPVLEVGADGPFRLELARDVDGRPVDVLHILGRIDDARAARMEESLWAMIPTRRSASALLGVFRDGEVQACHSRPLALSQLLITHYLLNAALQHRVS